MTPTTSHIATALLLLAPAVTVLPAARATADVSVVFAEGTPVAGAVPGAEWYFLQDFDLAEDDGLAFLGRMTPGVGGVTTSNDRAIFFRSPYGTLSIVARRGDAAPGFPAGATFLDFGGPLAAEGSTVGFGARARGPGVSVDDDTGTWLRAHQTDATLVAREGDTAPGTVGLAFRNNEEGQRFVVREGEVVIFGNLVDLSMPPAGVGFVSAPSPPEPLSALLALGGTPTPATGNWLSVGLATPSVSHNHVVFWGWSDTEVRGLWGTTTPGATLEYLVGFGDPVPTEPSVGTLLGVNGVRVESDGEVVFTGSFEPDGGGDSLCGAWARALDGTLTALVIEGAPIPDGSDPYACMLTPLRSPGGHLSFLAQYGYSGTPPRAFFATSAGGPLAMVISEGDDVPGLVDEPELIKIERWSASEGGGVVMEFFVGALVGRDRVYYYYHPEEGLSPLLREGDTIPIGPGDDRVIDTVTDFDVSLRHAMFGVNFTDGTAGLLETLLPGAPPLAAPSVPALSRPGIWLVTMLLTGWIARSRRVRSSRLAGPHRSR